MGSISSCDEVGVMGKIRSMAAMVALTMCMGGATVAMGQTKAAPPEPKVKVGDVAPDFTLKDQTGKEVSLHDFKGKKDVALAFYIFAFTGG
jgi:cytochrome oxidase Cu insertion factor (SCO1/SenC/PrrC family)